MSSIKSRSFSIKFMALLLLLLPLIFSGCAGGGGTEVGNAGCSTFKDSRELGQYLKNQFAKSILPSSSYHTKNTLPDYDNEISSAPGASPSYSGTNIQEQGVDESDKLKTDGIHIYVAGDRKVSVVDVSDASNMKVISAIPIDGSLDELYLKDGVLVVFYDNGQNGIYMDFDLELSEPVRIGLPYWIPIRSKTSVSFYDVRIPSDPKLISTVTMDGDLVSSRLINGKLHVVQQFLPDLPNLDFAYDGTEQGWESAISKNTEKLESLTLEEMLPAYSVCDSEGRVSRSGSLVEPQNFYRLDDAGGSAIVSISTFDLDHLEEPFKSVGIVATADIIYASTTALYLTAPEWNYDETYSENAGSTTSTSIHKFDLTGTNVRHEAGGRVRGRILNQFSMGEYQDVLRIATTEYRWNQADGSNSGTSNVYCLRNQDSNLEVMGRIENIAPGENMYSARFIGKRGFLVTFEQVDPLFTLDLSDPEKPFVKGELKVPGYSEYIHPMDEDKLITIGRNVAEIEGRLIPQGLQLSLFDISDLGNPVLLHKELIGDQSTYSEATYNHKAFNYWAEKNLLSIPVRTYGSQDYSTLPEGFNGLYIYKVTAQSGFELKGRIETGTDPSYLYQDWTRGIFITGSVFAVRPQALFSADMDGIEGSQKKLSLE